MSIFSSFARKATAMLSIAILAGFLAPTPAEAAANFTTRRATSWFDGQACIAGKCAPIGQAFLWYDSWDKGGKDFRRAQLNWGTARRPCNTWVDFDAWSTDGKRHLWHAQGKTHTGCRLRDAVATTTLNPGALVIREETATICGTVFRAGSPGPKLVTRVCVYV